MPLGLVRLGLNQCRLDLVSFGALELSIECRQRWSVEIVDWMYTALERHYR
jgi:hypothetical protein